MPTGTLEKRGDLGGSKRGTHGGGHENEKVELVRAREKKT